MLEEVDINADDECAPRISFKSKVGCPVVSLATLWAWVKNNKVVMSILFIAIGLVLTFVGLYFFKIVLFITGILVTIVIGMVIFYTLILSNDT